MKKTIFADEKLGLFVKLLSEDRNDICQKFYKILKGKTKSEVLFSCDKSVLDLKYAQFFNEKEGKVHLILNRDRLMHLVARGHLTGKATKGLDDAMPLEIEDIKGIVRMFVKPNRVFLRDGNLEIDKYINYKPLRLIVRPDKSFSKLTIISFYNATPVSQKKELNDKRK